MLDLKKTKYSTAVRKTTYFTRGNNQPIFFRHSERQHTKGTDQLLDSQRINTLQAISVKLTGNHPASLSERQHTDKKPPASLSERQHTDKKPSY